MRLWASIDSISLDELASSLGTETKLRLGFQPSFISKPGERQASSRWPMSLRSFGERSLAQIPELYRSATALTGDLRRHESGTGWLIESEAPVTLIGLKPYMSSETLPTWIGESETVHCHALGTLSVAGSELSKDADVMLLGVVHGFITLNLNSGSPDFGTWVVAHQYSELGSDPDVIGAPVCLAEIELGQSPVR